MGTLSVFGKQKKKKAADTLAVTAAERGLKTEDCIKGN